MSKQQTTSRVGEEELQTSLHDQILGSLTRHSCIKNRTLLDNRWVICLDDPNKKRNAFYQLKFDVVIAPGKRLTDPEFELDLITVKLCVYWSLSASEGKFSTGSPVGIFVRSLIQFTRWRISRGIPTNASLTYAWVEEFFETIAEKGIMGLLPLEERAAEYAAALRSGQLEVPTYKYGKHTHFSFGTAAKKLGVEDVRQLPRKVLAEIVTLAQELGYPLHSSQRRSAGFSSGAERMPSDGAPAAGRVSAFLTALNYLFQIRGRLEHDPIGCDPFPGDRNPNSVARAIARESDGRTLTVPPLQACTLIDQALSWVLDYAADIKLYVEGLQALLRSPHLQTRSRLYQLAAGEMARRFAEKTLDAPTGSPWPIRAAYFPGRRSIDEFDTIRPSLRTVLFEYLAVACVIVIATFSARRREELESLREGCISWEHGDPWLETWIEKTILDLDKVPVPNSVARAVEVLEWLSQLHRERTGRRWLLEFDEVIELEKGNRKRPKFDICRSLERFARFVAIPSLPDGAPWTPLPHQFRRFFGCVYYHRWRYPHLTALSNFYRHFDPDQTRRYVTEAARGGFLRRDEDKRVERTAQERRARVFAEQRLVDFEAEGEAFRVDRFRNVALGREQATGFGGEALSQELRQLVNEAKVNLDLSPSDGLPAETLDSLLVEFARGKRLEPNSLGHSYCKCTNDSQDLRGAACLTAREERVDQSALFSAPDPAYAADEVCSGCPHNVQLGENEPYWQGTIEQEERQASCALAPLLRLMSERRLEMARRHHRRCFGSEAGLHE
jgi:hypothetical protein